MGYPDGLKGKKKSACNAGDSGDTGSIPGSGRFPGGGNGNPLQYSCLKNPMDGGAWAGYSPKSHKELAQLDNKDIHERLIESVFLKSEYNCFTTLCYFLSYSRENQRYLYIYPLLLTSLPPLQPRPTP